MAGWPALFVCLLCAAFALSVLRSFLRNRRISHAFWMISLVFSAIASLAYCFVLWTHPHSSVAFILYYIFGALWMPALMGLGSISLVLQSRWVAVCLTVVGVLGLFGTVYLSVAPLNHAALQAVNGGAGVGVVETGPWLVALIMLNTFGAVAVGAVAVVSGWLSYRSRKPWATVIGNVSLAVGILVISLAGSAARSGFPELFWIVMALGWVITFLGYKGLTPPRRMTLQQGATSTRVPRAAK